MAKKISLPQSGAKRVTRCSSLPLLFSCPNAILNPEKLVPVRVNNGLEQLGNLIHAAIQRAVETGDVDFRQIEARYEQSEIERAKFLFANGMKAVEEARRDMKNPQFEVEIAFETEKFSVTGHVDVLDLHPTRAYVLDFKTGRTRDDHYHQMVGYAVGAWSKMGRPRSFEVHAAYIYLETGEVTVISLTAADMDAWIKELDGLPVQYAVNRRCVYCPLHDSCPAFRTYVKGSMGFLLDVKNAPETVKKMDKEQLSRLAIALKVADDSKERIRSYIKDMLLKTGKDLEFGNGDKFAITTTKRKILLTQKALPIIAKYVTTRDVAKATTLGLQALLTAAASRAKGGMRAVMRNELETKLRAAGAVVETESVQMRTVFVKDKKWPKKSQKK